MATLSGNTNRWGPGDALVVSERWHGHLWSAVPHTLVDQDDKGLVTFLAADAVGAYATSRGVPGREHLSRGERKLMALQTRTYRVVEVPHHVHPLASLHFFRLGSWSRVSLGWAVDFSRFLGWYINFEMPYRKVDHGVQTMDLVLDIVVAPDRSWRWKDLDEFDQALHRGILEPDVVAALVREAQQVTGLISRRRGPFADRWLTWRPDPSWRTPALPQALRAGGDAWQC